MRARALCLLAVWLASTTREVAAQDPEEYLASRYSAKVLYLTYTTLVDMYVCLTDDDQWSRLKQYPGAIHLRAFLKAHYDKSISKTWGLLVIDFGGQKKAFYKRASDNDASLTPIGWSGGETVEAAIFVDHFLRTNADLDRDLQKLRAGPPRVATALEVVGAWRVSPFIPQDRQASLLVNLSVAARIDADGMASLKEANRELWAEVRSLAKPDLARALGSVGSSEPDRLPLPASVEVVDAVRERFDRAFDTEASPAERTLHWDAPFRPPSTDVLPGAP